MWNPWTTRDVANSMLLPMRPHNRGRPSARSLCVVSEIRKGAGHLRSHVDYDSFTPLEAALIRPKHPQHKYSAAFRETSILLPSRELTSSQYTPPKLN